MNITISIGGKTHTFRLVVVIIILFAFWVIFGHIICSCTNFRESFESMNKRIFNYYTAPIMPGYAKEGMANIGDTVPNAGGWNAPSLAYKKGKRPSKGVKNILNRQKQPIPLPDGEMDMFATTQFKPECCPNAYSSSTGCACMTVKQYNYLIDRGGNNVPYNEY
jgi:hypothetical protein